MEEQEDNDGDQSKPVEVVAAVGGGGVHSFFLSKEGAPRASQRLFL